MRRKLQAVTAVLALLAMTAACANAPWHRQQVAQPGTRTTMATTTARLPEPGKPGQLKVGDRYQEQVYVPGMERTFWEEYFSGDKGSVDYAGPIPEDPDQRAFLKDMTVTFLERKKHQAPIQASPANHAGRGDFTADDSWRPWSSPRPSIVPNDPVRRAGYIAERAQECRMHARQWEAMSQDTSLSQAQRDEAANVAQQYRHQAARIESSATLKEAQRRAAEEPLKAQP